MTAARIPLARPRLGAEEIAAARRVLESGRLTCGPEVEAFEAELAAAAGRRSAVAVSSGTAALYVALRALGLAPGAGVVVPDLTFPAPANAVEVAGGFALLADVRPRTLDLDPRSIAALAAGAATGPRASGVLPVDPFGAPADWAAIAEAAAAAGLWVLEDAACSVGARRGALKPGDLAAAACLSFHPRKLLTTGEGGAVLTDRPELAAACRSLRDHGRLPGLAGARAFGPPALNLRLAEIPAAIGRAQLARLEASVAEQRRLAALYGQALAGSGIEFQEAPADALHTYQTLVALLPAPAGRDRPAALVRDAVLRRLAAEGIEAGLASFALHRLPHYAPRAAAGDAAFPAASDAADRGLALPLFDGLGEGEVARVAEALRRAVAAESSPPAGGRTAGGA